MSNAQDYYLLMLRQLNGGLPQNTTAPSLGASPVVGSQLAYTRGVWTDTTSRSTQAQRRLLGGAWANAGSAWDSVVGTPYTPVAADFGYTFKVIETSTPGSVTATSNETAETTITGLVMRLDSSNAATLFQDSAGTVPATADNDVVGYWGDTVGARNAIQATTANKPVLKLAIQNGRNILRFDSTDVLVTPTLGSIAQPNSIFLVGKTNNATMNMTLIDGDSGLTQRHLIGTRITTGYAQAFAGATLIDSTANRTGSFRLFGVVYNGVSSSIRVNGAVGASGDAGSQSLGAVYIGRNNAGQPLIGDMSEVMVFTTAPTAGEITAIESYLNAKWAVY